MEKCLSSFTLQFNNPNGTFINELRCKSTSAAAAAVIRSPISVSKFRSEKRVLGNIKIRFVVTSMFACLIAVPREGYVSVPL
jgi:hypothetical protein